MILDSGQVVLTTPKFTLSQSPEHDALLHNTLLYPSYVAAVSMPLFLGQAIAIAWYNRGQSSETIGGFSNRVRKQISDHGGSVIFAFKLSRLVACFALAGLSLASLGEVVPVPGFRLDNPAFVQVTLCATFVYASLLAVLTVATPKPWNSVATKHLIVVLLAALGVYVYRDLWPLATFTLKPEDAAEGWFLWTKVVLLTFAAAVVPFTMPTQYIPFDFTNPSEKPHPEQTASWLDFIFFNYLTPLVIKGYKQPHLTIDDLPPINDRDKVENMVDLHYSSLDPLQTKKKRHIFFGLVLKAFLREHIGLALGLILRVVASFAAPIGIRNLLGYLETGGEGAVVRPWFWVTWLFFGPVLQSLAFNFAMYFGLAIVVKGQTLLTQLIFDHALRMRINIESSDDHAGIEHPDSPESQASGQEQSEINSDTRETNPSTIVPEQDAASTSSRPATPKGRKEPAPQGPKPETKNLAGRLNNLVSGDMNNLQGGQSLIFLLFFVPTQLTLSLIYLYSLLGWSVLAGVVVMVLLSPLPGIIVKRLATLQAEKMKKSDSRVQSVTEAMNVIRMIKLFGWETKMSAVLDEKRTEELKYIRKSRLAELANMTVSSVIPCMTMVVTYGAYTLAMGRQLTASRVFASMLVFELVHEHFQGIFYLIPHLIKAKVSLDRINDFLYQTELLDQFSEDTEVINSTHLSSEISIRQAAFTWSKYSSGETEATPRSRRKFTLRVEDEVIFKQGCVNLVIGQTGSGKTSLLMALLGEMHYIQLGPQAAVTLPREKGVAYHAQESWVLNETIRNNILFGAPYDEARYNSVIEQCALKRDLELFDAGDLTEVGEKGITLSGGQKARVTLARAVYSSAEILLLDDVLAALDVHTSRWIVDHCFKGDLMHGRTVILVTHNVALTAPIADFVVSLAPDGRIASQGALSTALAKDKKLSAQVAKESEVIEKAKHEIDTGAAKAAPDGKLIVDEEVPIGHVTWAAMKLFFANATGKSGIWLFWAAFFLTLALSKVLSNLEVWIISLWTRQYDLRDPSDISAPFYLALYAIDMIAQLLTYGVAFVMLALGSLRASRIIHRLLVDSIFTATLRWLDRTPVSRIITRCSQDIQDIDGQIPTFLMQWFDVTFVIITKFAAVVFYSPIFIIPGIFLVIAGVCLGRVYMRAQLAVKRESSNARAPVLGHFGAAVAGLVSIRAYSAQDMFRKELYQRNDRYTRVSREFWNLNRWISIQTDILAGIFCASLAAYLIYGKRMDSSRIGFSINMAVGFSSMILYWVRVVNLVETQSNSLERIHQYLEIEHEPKPTESGVPPAYWPASGDLRVEKLSARYSADGPKVLHDLDFEIKSGEHIGIVGRTGSGKSSLTLALLRCILTEGTVYYDGFPTSNMNLDALRSSITIIPQVPELLGGTVRQNLDPFSQHDDAVLNDALRSAGLFSLQDEDSSGRITLDSQITGSGSNLSVGQRQILALARAMVRQSKLLILDEATSAIDYETDTIIQTSLRKELSKDVTLLVVAHRLQTIMDADRIMVLDAGRIAEFDKPSELLKNEDSLLRALVEESGDKEFLTEMASGSKK